MKTITETTKERPILSSGQMVRALLDGRKTQTRRMLKPQPDENGVVDWMHRRPHLDFNDFGWHGTTIDGFERKWLCPYGQVGDVLWVRETWAWLDGPLGSGVYVFKVDYDGPVEWNWKPSIFMPREASRIKLRITDIRVERLQDISKADAIAEGVLSRPHSEDPQLTLWYDYSTQNRYAHGKGWGPVESYQSLWQSINGPDSWASKPFVWVIQFERITDLAL